MLSYRKLAMRVLGRPLHTGGIDSPRPASQRAAAFILTAAMLTTLAAPAFAEIWHIEDGDITVKAGETGNDVTQKGTTTYGDTDTIITNSDKNTASSHTVTIDAKDKDDKVEVTLKDVNIDASSRSEAAVSVTGKGDTTIELDGDNELKSGANHAGVEKNNSDSKGTLTIKDDTGEKGSLTATGGAQGAGIGGAKNNSGSNIEITGGTITATGGCNNNEAGNGGAAGIGGGFNGSGTDIKITGGNVTANGSRKPDGTSGCQGAGIGGGYGKGGTNISISGEDTVVNANGGKYGAGIGGGSEMCIRDSNGCWRKHYHQRWRSCNSQRWCTGCRHWRRQRHWRQWQQHHHQR